MTIRGDLQVLIDSAIEHNESGQKILTTIFDELTSGDFISAMIGEEIDPSDYCLMVDALKRKCL